MKNEIYIWTDCMMLIHQHSPEARNTCDNLREWQGTQFFLTVSDLQLSLMLPLCQLNMACVSKMRSSHNSSRRVMEVVQLDLCWGYVSRVLSKNRINFRTINRRP